MLAIGTGRKVEPYRAGLREVQQLVKHNCIVHVCTEHVKGSFHFMTLLLKDNLVLLLDPLEVRKEPPSQCCYGLAKACCCSVLQCCLYESAALGLCCA